jgi:hypothetical protein
MTHSRISLLLAFSAVTFAESAPAPLPAEWGLNNPGQFTATTDHAESHSGAASGVVAARGPSVVDFGGLIQATDASAYRGKRIRYSGHLKTQGATGWAGLWFRADDSGGNVVAFDNMQATERRVSGDTSWARYSIVIDVPANAAIVVYGVTLSGAGRVWADDLNIEVVDSSVPVTVAARELIPAINPPLGITYPLSPRNLGFEQ